MRKLPAILLTAAFSLSGFADVQAAPTQAQQQAIRASCQSDYRAHCASVPTGGSAALQCLEKNLSSLSAACQQAVNAVTGGGTASTSGQSSGSAASGASATTSGGSGGGTAPNPQANTAAQPKSVVIVLEPGQELAVMREACGADYRTYCAGTRILGGGALTCLVSHASSLSVSCKGMLSKLGQRF